MIRLSLPALYLGLIVAPALAQGVLALTFWDVRFGVTAMLTAAAVVLAVVLGALRVIEARVLLIGTGASWLAILVLSGSAIAAVAALSVLAAAGALGWALMRALAPAALPSAERFSFATALGLGVTSYAMLALGLIGMMSVGGAIALLAVAMGAALWHARGTLSRRSVRLPSLPAGKAGPILWAGCAWSVVLLVEAVAPEVQYDALSYHLGLPRQWIDAGRLIDVPEQIQSYYYLGAEMNFALAALLGGPIAAKLLSFLELGLAVGAVYLLGRATASPRAATIAAALFGAIPAVAWQGTTTYVDVAVSMYVILALVASIQAWRMGGPGLTLVASLLLGLAVATKVTALLTAAPVLLLVLFIAWRQGSRARWPRIAMATLAFAIAFAPWSLLRDLQTGDPAFPLLSGVLHSPLWSGDVASDPAFDLARFVRRDAVGLLTWPFSLSYMAERFDDGAVGAGFGLALLLAPLGVVRAPRDPRVRALALTAGLALLAWCVSIQYARYVLPAFGALSVLAAIGLDGLASGRAVVARTAAAVPPLLMASGFVALLFLYPYVPDRIPYAVAFGLESADGYLRRTLPSYEPLRLVARTAGRDSDVLLLSFHAGWADDEDRLYAPGRVEPVSSPWTRALMRVDDPERVLSALRERGITHVFVNRANLPRAIAGAAVLQRAFLDRAGSLEYQRGPIELYRLQR